MHIAAVEWFMFLNGLSFCWSFFRAPSSPAGLRVNSTPCGCLYSIGGAGGECPSREKPLEIDACVQSTGPQQSRQRSTAGERKTAAFQSPIEFWHPTAYNRPSILGAVQ